jgi:hypothetical protein
MYAMGVGYAKSVVSKEECLKEERKEISEQEARGSWRARMQRSSLDVGCARIVKYQ